MRNLSLKIVNYLLVISILFFQLSCSEDTCEENPCAAGCEGIPCPECIEDPCGNPDLCPGQCGIASDGSLTKNEFKGDLVQVDDHYEVDGELEISLNETDKLNLVDADLRIEFDQDGQLQNISGTAKIPSPTNYVEFGDLVQADIGYFTGKYLNENRAFDITLLDDKFYFVYNIAVSVEMMVGANDDPEAHKPLTLKAPVGGHITYIADYTDPMLYLSGGHDLLGSMSFGASVEGNIPYFPLQPVDQGEAFYGKAFRSGSFTLFKVIDIKGTAIQNADLQANLVEENPLDISFNAGYQAGINGSFDFTLPIVSFAEFSIPLGEASGALLAEAGTSGVKGLVFVNGLAKPDNSWWPDFIPVKAGNQLRAKGFVHQDGIFEIELSGEYYLETPANKNAIAGLSRVDNQQFLLEGKFVENEDEWGVRAQFESEQTNLAAIPPEDLLQGLDRMVNEKIDSSLVEVEEARANLEAATKDYEFEVSLRGLRESIPAITAEARKQIKAGVDKAVADGRSQANKIVADNNAALCSDNINSEVNKVAAPYYHVLNRLDAAVKKEDDEQARVELEKALRDLIALQNIAKTIRIRVTAGNKKSFFYSACSIVKNNYYRNISFSRKVISDEQVEKLEQAADNVQYIPAASDEKVSAQKILDELPTQEELEKLKNDIQSGVKTIPTVEEVGFVHRYSDKSFTYYILIDGDRKEVSSMEFSADGLARVVIDLIK